MYSCQASAEHFQQCAESLLLGNRGLGPLAVTVLPVALAMRAAATVCGAPRGKMVSGKEATGIPGTSRSRLGKLARTARALFTAALQSPVQDHAVLYACAVIRDASPRQQSAKPA
jgi:hypothetical protein